MNHSIRLSVLLLAAAATLAAAPVDVTTRATAVTVYPDRALVTRLGAVQLTAGETEFVISGLPANLWDDSLQVRGSGPAGTSILDVQSRNVFVEQSATPEIRRLEDALTELRREATKLDDDGRAIEAERALLRRIGEAATTVPNDGAAPARSYDEWSGLLTFQTENLRRLDEAVRDLNRQREALNNRIAAAQAQLNEARGQLPGRRAVKQITVRARATAAGAGQLEISYTSPGAQWSPVYRARLDSAARRVGFDYEAQVINRTGEPWNNVALTLSTARPSAGGAAPEPMAWVVEESRPQPLAAAARLRGQFATGASMEMAEPMMAADKASSDSYFDMNVAQASIEAGLTSATFKIDAPASVPADGTMQKVAITTLDLPAALRHDTTPKLVPSAFLTATVTNNSDFPLLGGQLASFVDGAFIANSHFEQTMPGEEFDLALGVDEAVAVERTVLNRFVEETGAFTKGTRVTYEIKVELTNHKPIPVTLQLEEPLPRSRHEDIKVAIATPAARDIGAGKVFTRDDEGILTWNGTLAPGATRELTLKFSIEHPNSLNVIGVE